MSKDLKNKAIDFKGQKYVLVKDRVNYFNETYPNGSITTELLSEADADRVVVKATIRPNETQVFTGISQALWGEGFVNKSAAIENCETSAVGRALAFMGIGVIDSIASIDEINKAVNEAPQNQELLDLKQEIATLFEKNNIKDFKKYIQETIGKEKINNIPDAKVVLRKLNEG